jgi:hypothetical protein
MGVAPAGSLAGLCGVCAPIPPKNAESANFCIDGPLKTLSNFSRLPNFHKDLFGRFVEFQMATSKKVWKLRFYEALPQDILKIRIVEGRRLVNVLFVGAAFDVPQG